MHNEIHQKLFVGVRRILSYELLAHSKRGFKKMYSSRKKIHTHPMEGHQKFLGGGGGVQNKKSSLWGVWMFFGTAQFLKDVYLYLLSINS